VAVVKLVVFWNSTRIVPLAELVGGLAVLFEVSLTLIEEAPMDHTAVNGIMTQLSAPFAHFVMSPGVSYCAIH
jgi:hypothetical protein